MTNNSSKSQKAEALEQKQNESPDPSTMEGVGPRDLAGMMDDEQLDRFVTLLMAQSEGKKAAKAKEDSSVNSGTEQQTGSAEEESSSKQERPPQERMAEAALAAISLSGIELPPEPIFRRTREIRKSS